MLLLLVLVALASAQQTICEKYSAALGVNQTTLMKTVVSAIVVNEVSNSKIVQFFDGTKPPGSINFLADTEQFNRLAGGLVAFFGAALGCKAPGFPKYNGPSDMKALHQPMGIGKTEFDLFNDIFIETLAGLGVDFGDQRTIRMVLDGFAPAIINPKVLTICEKYSGALGLNQTALMQTIVGQIIVAEVSNPRILAFFNGTTPPGSTNFLANPAALARLSNGLVAFFGAALGCNSPSFPKYTGPTDMKALHQPMGISKSNFVLFNDIFVQKLAALGVDLGDQATIRTVLDSFADAIINPHA